MCQNAIEQSTFTPTIAFQFKYRYKFEGGITSVRIHWVEDRKQYEDDVGLNYNIFNIAGVEYFFHLIRSIL